MSTSCKIKFVDRENGVFFPGEILRGSVQLITTKPKTIQEISVLVSGKSKVHWIEGRGSNSITFRNEFLYFTSKLVLHKDHEVENFELSEGTRSYYFEIDLPDDIPSSYQGQFGENHYEVKVALSRTWKYDNEFVQPFTVIYPVDINNNIEVILYKHHISEYGDQTSCMSCCKMKPIRLKVQIPHSGYVSGQHIPVSLEVSNSSKLNCHKIVIKLDRHVQFLASTPSVKTKYSKTKIMKIELPGFRKSTEKSFSAKLPVPPTVPSSTQMFDIIKIEYTISVKACPGPFHQNFKMFIPITIGTIPLLESMQNYIKPLSTDAANAPVLTRTHMSNCKESQPERKLFVDKDRDKFIKYGPFTPKYPVFNDPKGKTNHK